MARVRCITEMGMGVDVRGRDATKAARRAVSDAIRHSSLGFFRLFGKTAQDMFVDVTIGVQQPDKVDIETISVATGLLLPVWNKLPQDDVRVWRINDAAGTSILGRIVMPGAIEKLESAFGLTSSIVLTPDELIKAARHGDGALILGLHGARLVSAMVNDSRRLEIRDFRPQDREWLKARGAFSEVIAYKTRLFLPAGKADEILSTIIAEPPQ